ncbi:hypothetical protein [Mycoplasmopsis adleri]|uniref:hypothetical protein n=1 Tax=Mycoplasmopsis adleri TaxID=51362 RepID=UPI003872E6C5
MYNNKNNMYYFLTSQLSNNYEDIINDKNPMGVLVISENINSPATELMDANDQLIELIATYKTLSGSYIKNEKILNTVIDKIINLVETTNRINYSPFLCLFSSSKLFI